MATLAIDRSTAVTSAVIATGGQIRALSAENWMEEAAKFPLERIIVGTGPGSFAGIRSALAFAQGYAIGSAAGTEVLGLASAAAFAEEESKKAIIGDARRGKFWVALFDGFRLVRDIFLVEREGLAGAVGGDRAIETPDFHRIGALLVEVFGERSHPAPPIDAVRLLAAAEANSALLVQEPLPIYLNPAVRDK